MKTPRGKVNLKIILAEITMYKSDIGDKYVRGKVMRGNCAKLARK